MSQSPSPAELIVAKLSALEFIAAQLYAQALKGAGGDALENARATQGRAMMGMQAQLEAAKAAPNYAALVLAAGEVARFYESLVQNFERDKG